MKSSGLVGMVVALALLVPAAPAAAKVGTLKQLPGKAGCVAQQDATKSVKKGCTVARFGGHQMWDAVASPDGRNLYVVSVGGAVSVLRIDKHGHLHQRRGKAGCFSRTGSFGCTVAPPLNSSQTIAISRDGRSVYVGSTAPGTGFGGVVVFGRNPKTGALHRTGCVGENGTRGCVAANALLARVSKIAVSPNGQRVYVGSNTSDPGGAQHGAIAVFVRAASGALTPSGCLNGDASLGCTQARGLLPECCGIAVSPNSGNVYASSSQIDVVPGTFQTQSGHFALASFASGPSGLTQLPGTSGCLNQDGSGGCAAAAFAHPDLVNLAVAVLLSPNGRSLYLAHVSNPTDFESGNCDGPDNFIAAFPRNATDGTVGALQQDLKTCGSQPVMSPDGRSVYASTGTFGNVLSLLSRNATTGTLLRAGCIGIQVKGCHGAKHVTAPSAVAVTPNGRYTYVISDESGLAETIGVFRRRGR
jgi:hypothetical protein